MIQFPEGEYSYYRYFNEKGIAIFSLYTSISGMNNGFSVSRYLNKEGDLLLVDFIRCDDALGGNLIEHTIRYGGYDLTIPLMYGNEGEEYDSIYNIGDLADSIDLGHLTGSNHFVSVQFFLFQKEDKTIINENSVNLRKDASTTYNHIHKLNVGDEVTILDVEGNWYKVEFHNRYGDNKIGYVLGDYLEPVEKEVK